MGTAARPMGAGAAGRGGSGGQDTVRRLEAEAAETQADMQAAYERQQDARKRWSAAQEQVDRLRAEIPKTDLEVGTDARSASPVPSTCDFCCLCQLLLIVILRAFGTVLVLAAQFRKHHTAWLGAALNDACPPVCVAVQAEGLKEQVKELQKRVAQLKASAMPSQAELKQLAALEKQVQAEEAEADKCRQSFAPLKSQVSSLVVIVQIAAFNFL